MTEIQQGGGSETKNVVSTSETTAAVVVGSKRQRRPSVRLGDIGGDPPYDSFTLISSSINNNNNNSNLNSNSRIRTSKHQNPSNNNNTQFSNNLTKPSKIKPLTNLTVPQTLQQQQQQHNDYDNDSNVDRVVVGGGWRPKDSKKQRGGGGAKRVRSNNWVGRGSGGGGGGDDDDDEIENEGYGRGEFHIKNSESPMTPLHSSDNVEREEEDDLGYRHNFNTRSMSNNNNEEGGRREDGVTIWLRSLGLGRYAPVFEIHEVDDEVLPLLTLEDLKDMGINAVGSRRKMFCAIQKLSKGFS